MRAEIVTGSFRISSTNVFVWISQDISSVLPSRERHVTIIGAIVSSHCFSTKNRVAYLTDKELLIAMHKYLHGICDKQDCSAIKVGGVADHVHILCRLAKTGSVATLIGHLKRDSSKHAKTISPRLKQFQWQAGYGAFSISPGHVDALVQYIANQEDHHRKVTFQEEFRTLLRKYRIEYDERYVWD